MCIMSEAKEGKNAHWQFFRSIYEIVGIDKRYLLYVICVKCEKILSYDSAKGGTSHLCVMLMLALRQS
jgi:hypothetical protein